MRNVYFMLLMCFAISISYTQPQVEIETFASGFTRPVDITNAGDDRLFIVERPGVIKIINADGTVEATPFLDIDSRVSNSGGERGLLGLAFHPDYANNGYFFVNYIDNGGSTVVARYAVSGDNPNIADIDSEKVILTESQPFSNHNGGDLAFGPDGYLYIGLGDGGAANDPGNRSQNRTTLLGKMLRIDIDNGDPYAIPEDNPFADDDFTLDEIWSIGLRNPWRYSFDRLTGDIWIADVGQNDFEEVNVVAANSPGGENYGWRCYEGNSVFDDDCELEPDSLVFPVHTYATGSSVGCSVTGGYVYRGNEYPGMYGYYFYGDFCSDRIFALRQDVNGNWINAEVINTSNVGISSFGEDQNGELYMAGLSNGIIYRLSDACGSFNLMLSGLDESCPDSLDGSIMSTITDGTGPFSYEWSNDADTENLSNIAAGDYELTLTANDGCELIRRISISNDAPEPPVILTTMDSLEIEDNYEVYRWFRDGDLIGGANNPSIIPIVDGPYSVEVTNTSGCSQTFFIADVVLINSREELQLNDFQLSPNPTRNVLNITGMTSENGSYQLQIFNNLGQSMLKKEVQWSANFTETLHLSHLPQGTYYLSVSKDQKTFTRPFQIQ